MTALSPGDRVRLFDGDEPWPVVDECYTSIRTVDHACPQCDGSHDHEWVGWRERPVGVFGRHGIPVRCKVCGGRKCDLPSCLLRRGHLEEHDAF